MDDRRLRKFFHFTENDLDTNRRGGFSDNQKKRLLAEAKAEQKSARESAVILFVVAAVGMAFGLTLASVAPTTMSRTLFLFVLGILWPFAWAGKGVKIIRAARTSQEPRLRQVSGRVHIIKHDDETYVLQVRELEFGLDGNPAGMVMEGDDYTVYYLEATEEILSAEYLIRGN